MTRQRNVPPGIVQEPCAGDHDSDTLERALRRAFARRLQPDLLLHRRKSIGARDGWLVEPPIERVEIAAGLLVEVACLRRGPEERFCLTPLDRRRSVERRGRPLWVSELNLFEVLAELAIVDRSLGR